MMAKQICLNICSMKWIQGNNIIIKKLTNKELFKISVHLLIYNKGPFKYYVTLFWPILVNPPLPHVSIGDNWADPPSPCDDTFWFSIQTCILPSKKQVNIQKYGSKFWKKCHVTLCLIPSLPLVAFDDTVP